MQHHLHSLQSHSKQTQEDSSCNMQPGRGLPLRPSETAPDGQSWTCDPFDACRATLRAVFPSPGRRAGRRAGWRAREDHPKLMVVEYNAIIITEGSRLRLHSSSCTLCLQSSLAHTGLRRRRGPHRPRQTGRPAPDRRAKCSTHSGSGGPPRSLPPELAPS